MTLTGSGPTVPHNPSVALYDELLRTAPATGRCPVVLSPDVLAEVRDRRDAGPVSAIDRIDPCAVLTDWWPGGPCRPGCPCEGQMSGPMPVDPAGPSFPDRSRDAETIATAARSVGPLDLLSMIDATRPADVPALVGWSGICNYVPYLDLERLCAVLRHWESRWGAVLVAADRSRLHLSVAYPPRTADESIRAAAEHFAFCPDQQDPQNGYVYTLSSYAATIRGAGSWSFWWD